MIAAVIFDLDGVIVDSEAAWDQARRTLVADTGGTWKPEATRAMLGMASNEWSRYVADELRVPLAPEAINAEVVRRLLEVYDQRLPLIAGAPEAVRRLAERWPLGLASSSNRVVIDLVLERSGLAECFRGRVSSEEVGRGKPAPDVFIEGARRVGVEPGECAAVEDSHNGILSAKAAGMRVLALPNHDFPPGPEAMAAADRVLGSPDELTIALVESL